MDWDQHLALTHDAAGLLICWDLQTGQQRYLSLGSMRSRKYPEISRLPLYLLLVVMGALTAVTVVNEEKDT